ncbi:unnamed protein product [Linum trigynum]|uniref:Uncharacterized protein n=1 Tax=Linum trigynum TaxID=586398 RepID=A0AAV2ESW7_9ROSI
MEFFEEFPQSFKFKAEPVSDESLATTTIVIEIPPPSLPKPLAILHEAPNPAVSVEDLQPGARPRSGHHNLVVS